MMVSRIDHVVVIGGDFSGTPQAIDLLRQAWNIARMELSGAEGL